jgi:formyl-CoA transferase
MTALPLAGLRVLELGNYIAAPTAGRLLADFGAEVIKVERPDRGDEIRTWRLYRGRTSMLHRTLNRNKKSVELDLRSDEGRVAALTLTAGCDVVLENFRPGTLESWVPPLAERIIDVALNEAVLSVTESLVPDHLAYGVERRRSGGRVEGIAPSNAYPCLDGSSVVVAGNGDAIFHRFMEAIGRPDLAERADLQDNSARWAHVDELDTAIDEWTCTRPRDDVLAALAKAGVPAGPISTAGDIVADPQYAARNMIQYRDVDTGDGVHRVGFPGIVPVIGDRSLPVRSLGPELGEHNDEILGELSCP